jgi:hypothetical protein
VIRKVCTDVCHRRMSQTYVTDVCLRFLLTHHTLARTLDPPAQLVSFDTPHTRAYLRSARCSRPMGATIRCRCPSLASAT